MCCARLAGNAGPKKSPKSRHLGTIVQICRAVSSQIRHVSTIGKNLLSSNISSTCPHNMVNFGPLAAEICWRVWDTPANFNGFRVLAALLYGILVVVVSQTLRCWTQGLQFSNNADIWQTLKVLNCSISQISQIHRIVITKPDNGSVQNVPTASQTLDPLMFNLQHVDHQPRYYNPLWHVPINNFSLKHSNNSI